MKLGLALLAASLFSSSAAYANTVTLTFTASGFEVPITSNGLNGSNLGTYNIQPGSCSPVTTCIWGGSYTSTNSSFLAGSFTITTTRSDGEDFSGVQDSVGADSLSITGAPSDVDTTISLTDDNTGSHEFFFITNGVLDGALDITGYANNGSLYCSSGSCSIAEIANQPSASFEGEPFATFSFDDGNTVGAAPEPSSLALLGTGVIGIVGTLRRRFNRAA